MMTWLSILNAISSSRERKQYNLLSVWFVSDKPESYNHIESNSGPLVFICWKTIEGNSGFPLDQIRISDWIALKRSQWELEIFQKFNLGFWCCLAAGREKEAADACLPLISNVVSLSGSSPLPAGAGSGEAESDDSPSGGSNSNRRATLRFKRGIEISFDVDSNGHPVTVNPASGETLTYNLICSIFYPSIPPSLQIPIHPNIC